MTDPVPSYRPLRFMGDRPRRASVPGLLRLLAGLLLLAALWIQAVLAIGVPGAWYREIERRLPPLPVAVEAETLRFDFLRGLRLQEVRLYRKGDPGPPAAAADAIRISFSPLAGIEHGDWIQRVQIRGGVLRRTDWTGTAAPRPAPLPPVRFRLELEECRVFNQWVARASAQALLMGNQIRFEQGTASIGDPEGPQVFLQGGLEVDIEARRYMAAITWTGHPAAIDAFLRAHGQTTAGTLFREFQEGARPAHGEAEMAGAFGTNWQFSLKASGAARACRFRNEPIRQLFLSVRFLAGAEDAAALVFDPAVIIRDDGVAVGTAAIDFATGDVRFDGYSTCPPLLFVRLLAPGVAARLGHLRPTGSVRLQAGGTLNPRDFSRNAVTWTFDGREVGVDRWRLDRLSLSGRLSGTSAEIWNLSGAGFGGVFTGAVDMAAAWSPDRTLERLYVAARGGVEDVSGSALARAFGLPGAERYEGRLSIAGGVNGATGPGALQTLRGEGRIRLTAGRLFRVPVFSPLIEFLDRLIPGADLSSSRTDAAADWTLADGQVRAESIVVGGDLINLSGHGAYALTRNLDFDIQVKLMKDTTLLGKAVRALTLPVSKLFEFRVRGTPGRPHWYPVNFSSDLLEKIPFTGRGGASQSEPAGP